MVINLNTRPMYPALSAAMDFGFIGDFGMKGKIRYSLNEVYGSYSRRLGDRADNSAVK